MNTWEYNSIYNLINLRNSHISASHIKTISLMIVQCVDTEISVINNLLLPEVQKCLINVDTKI